MSSKVNKFKSLLPPALLLLAVFGATLILFLEFQPFILFDTDDWRYISIQRPMIFIPGYWNPTRVFPEVFMPFCGNIAAYVVMPFAGDYVEALKITFALVYAAFITVYVGLFFRLLRKRFAATTATAVLASATFFLFHFIVFTGGTHLFQNDGPTNLFYYSMSMLLCASLVIFLMADDMLDGFFAKRHLAKKGVFFAVLFLALDSNLYASIILAAYVGIDLLLSFLKTLRERRSVRSFFAHSVPKLLVIVFWGIVQVLEATGSRASGISEPVSLVDSIVETGTRFVSCAYDPLFFGLAGVVLVAFFVMLLRNRKEMIHDPRMRMIGIAALAGALVLAYLILLCARTGARYIVRADVLASFFFYVITTIVFCLVMVMNRYPRTVIIVPVCILFLVFYVRPVPSTEAALRSEITHDLIAQVQEGAEAGEDTVELHVPVYNHSSNWPLAKWIVHGLPLSLYRHGLVDHPVTIELIPDPAMNEKHGIPLP